MKLPVSIKTIGSKNLPIQNNLPDDMPNNLVGANDRVGIPAHEVAYQKLRDKILFGELKPGNAVTLHGIADLLGLSLTPIRESVRRLIAERALEFHNNRRISVPVMTFDKLEEIYIARKFLEGELAFRACLNVEHIDIVALEEIDHNLDLAISEGDIFNYLKNNFLFHRELYKSGDSGTLLPIVETLWLQLGPSLRVVCGRYGTSDLGDMHKIAIKALSENNAASVREAIHADILQGKQIVAESLSISR